VAAKKKEKKLYTQKIFLDWCKACGICIAFCPKKVFERGKDGKPVIIAADACIGCKFCEQHCPDLAISIEERVLFRRRKSDV
jgi:2-oxoglutarate ferredoxin oxidoreductase subunit delta